MNSFLDQIPVVAEISSVFRSVDPLERYPFHVKSRPHHGILYVIEGREIYETKDSVLKTYPGDVLYLPKSTPYSIHMLDSVCTVICIDFETSEPLSLPWFSVHAKNPQIFKDSFTEIEHLWKLKRPNYVAQGLSVFYRVISDMQNQLSKEYFPNERIRKFQPIIDYIHENYDDPTLRIEELAESFGVNPRYFYRVFKEFYSFPPKQYLTRLRMDKAKELIVSGKYNLSQIAEMSGYSDIYHFSKAFKAENGLPPTQYYDIRSR